uniref:Reverse transcriptase domain-containing protein n=1 Tax=Tanacetum cinerariifolium TaxID=118510 RepID=A0A6L2LWW8_TANCI|nr:hypothetical protein [Tanacetum cinerariifolium]
MSLLCLDKQSDHHLVEMMEHQVLSIVRQTQLVVIVKLEGYDMHFEELKMVYDWVVSKILVGMVVDDEVLHKLVSMVEKQLPQRSNENIRLEMVKLIKNNRIFLNNNVFPHEEASMELLNDSKTIDEMFKQRKQTANLAEKEEQADDEEVLQDREKFMKDVKTFLEKFSRISFGVMPKELSEYINSPSCNYPTFYDDEEYSIQYKEYLEKSPDAIAPILPTKEPEYSLSMGYEHLSTIPKMKLDEVTESSAKNLLPIPSEYEVTSYDEIECDVPNKDDSSPVFTTFSNPLFDDNDDFTSSDDVSLPDEVVLTEEFKVYSNPLFDDEEINSDKLDPYCFNAKSDLIKSLLNRDTLIDSSPKFDFLLKEFSGELTHISPILPGIKEAIFDLEEEIRLVENLLYDNSSPRPPEELNAEIADTIVESLSPSHIPVEDSDSLMDEIDLFLATDDLLPPCIKSDGYDLEGDIHFLEELLVDDSIPFPKNESYYFDHQDDLLFPRPPLKPPDVEFHFEPDSGEVISAVKNNNDELNEDECFDPGGEIDVFTNVEDEDYFPFIFFIRIFLPYLIYPEISSLLLSDGSEDTIFDPGISV